jgi:cell division initiation protein
LEIRQQQFHVKFRGFDPEEVDTFLDMVADELETLAQMGEVAKQEAAGLREKNRDLTHEIQRLREALKAAEKGKALTVETLRAEAADIRAQAAREAQTIIEAAKRERAEARRELEALSETRKQLLQRVRGLLESQLRLLEIEEQESQPEDRSQSDQ